MQRLHGLSAAYRQSGKRAAAEVACACACAVWQSCTQWSFRAPRCCVVHNYLAWGMPPGVSAGARPCAGDARISRPRYRALPAVLLELGSSAPVAGLNKPPEPRQRCSPWPFGRL
jgi:hypothetical protein